MALHESLGGGGTVSLMLDAQGKTYAQYLLATEVEERADKQAVAGYEHRRLDKVPANFGRPGS